MVAALVLIALHAGEPALDRPPLKAEAWLNVRAFRENDTRDRLILFFEPEDREAQRAVRRLVSIHRRGRFCVIGATRADEKDVRAFVRRTGARFPIAAGCGDFASWGVEWTPAIRRIRAGAAAEAATALELGALEGSDFAAMEESAIDPRKAREADPLRALIDSDEDWSQRAIAVRRLWELTAPPARGEFATFAEELLEIEQNPWVRAKLDYYRDLANGVGREDGGRSLSAAAWQAYRADPANEEWAVVQRFESEAATIRVAEIFERYQAAPTSSPSDLLTRRIAVEALKQRTSREEKVHETLIRILLIEPDPSIRLISVMGLGEVCPVGDLETADLLDELAASEPDRLRVVPMMTYISRYLRTGEEEPDSQAD